MPKKTKTKIIISALAITISLGGLFFILRKKPPGTSSVQNASNNQVQTAENKNNENRQTKSLFATKSGKDIYKIKKDGKWVVAIDGQESTAYDSVANPTFSSDGQKFAYSAYLGNQTYLVINNNSQAVSYKQIVSITFSPDGNRLAYVAGTGERSLVVLDNTAGKEYQGIGTLETSTGNTYVIFSPDSQKIAYKVVTDSGAFIVVNEQEGKTYDNVSSFQFSNDSQQFAYEATSGSQQLIVVNNTKVIVNNETATPSPTTSSTSGSGTTSTSTPSSRYNPSYGASENESGSMSYILNCSGSSGVADCVP